MKAFEGVVETATGATLPGSRSFKKPTILVADVPEGRETIKNIVGDRATLVPVTRMDEFLRQVTGDLDLIICGIHFDESRMFDLLRLALASRPGRACPVLCFRDLESELQPTLLESLDISCRALGALAFVDLYTLKRRYGIDAADAAFLKIIMGCLDREP